MVPTAGDWLPFEIGEPGNLLNGVVRLRQHFSDDVFSADAFVAGQVSLLPSGTQLFRRRRLGDGKQLDMMIATVINRKTGHDCIFPTAVLTVLVHRHLTLTFRPPTITPEEIAAAYQMGMEEINEADPDTSSFGLATMMGLQDAKKYNYAIANGYTQQQANVYFDQSVYKGAMFVGTSLLFEVGGEFAEPLLGAGVDYVGDCFAMGVLRRGEPLVADLEPMGSWRGRGRLPSVPWRVRWMRILSGPASSMQAMQGSTCQPVQSMSPPRSGEPWCQRAEQPPFVRG